MKKKTITTVVVIIAIVALLGLIAVFTAKHKAEEQKELAIYSVRYGLYDEALKRIDKLPKKTQECNRAYINYAQEFDNWSGTGEEIFHKLQEVYQDDIFSDPNLIFGKLTNEEISQGKALSKAFALWEEAYSVREHFFQEYAQICLENLNLYSRTPENGHVTFRWEELFALDDRMTELYYSDLRKLEQLKKNMRFFNSMMNI